MVNLDSFYKQIIEQMPVGILIVRVNIEEPSQSILIYFNKQANKELDLDLKNYLNQEMPELLISKKGILDKYVQVVDVQKSRKLTAKLKEQNKPEVNFSIVMLPLEDDYVAAIYQRIDDRIRSIELSKKLNKTKEELKDKQETIQDLMSELKTISVRIKKNGYKK